MEKITSPTQNSNAGNAEIEKTIDQYNQAKTRRENWESHWQECYDYALPQRGHTNYRNGSKRNQTLYDGTALDAVDQLAASLLGNLTPPWSTWFGFKPGPELKESEAQNLSSTLEDISRKIQTHLDNSNFAVEMHQCFLDLAVGGTATLFFEETAPGNSSAFKFSSISLQDVVLEEGAQGFLDTTHRLVKLTYDEIQNRYVDVDILPHLRAEGQRNPEVRFEVLESITPQNGIYKFKAILMNEGSPSILKEGSFNNSPAISFRWTKSPGEIYGRSPVMKSLPDIKTANKVVELILKNASIAVTGIWQADDDGVLNPANIELTPGSIIPKAVGSKGLTPLQMPGQFDVSQLVLNDLRSRIRHALLADKLGALNGKRMSATEVLERSNEMALLLGATYGRLQSELLTPLIQRAYSILRRRGEIPDIALDGRYITLEYRSPLARAQGQKDIQNILLWLENISSLGKETAAKIDTDKVAQHLADALGVPRDFIRPGIVEERVNAE